MVSMRAAWYEHRGDARTSLVVGEMPDPQPGDVEVRIAVRVSGVNPGDVKKRMGWQGAPMPYPRVVPHSDGAGTIDAIGSGVDAARLHQRVWCYGAQSYRPFGTAAEYVVVPDRLAVPLPPPASEPVDDLDEQASCLGIAGITGYRAVFADGDVAGLAVLVHGAAGGVGSIATQMARRGGTTCWRSSRLPEQQGQATDLGAHHTFLTSDPDLASKTPRRRPRRGRSHRRGRLRLRTSTSTPKSSPLAVSCPAISVQKTGPRFRTGRSASKTSPSDCWAATTPLLRSGPPPPGP